MFDLSEKNINKRSLKGFPMYVVEMSWQIEFPHSYIQITFMQNFHKLYHSKLIVNFQDAIENGDRVEDLPPTYDEIIAEDPPPSFDKLFPSSSSHVIVHIWSDFWLQDCLGISNEMCAISINVMFLRKFIGILLIWKKIRN